MYRQSPTFFAYRSVYDVCAMYAQSEVNRYYYELVSDIRSRWATSPLCRPFSFSLCLLRYYNSFCHTIRRKSRLESRTCETWNGTRTPARSQWYITTLIEMIIERCLSNKKKKKKCGIGNCSSLSNVTERDNVRWKIIFVTSTFVKDQKEERKRRRW